LDRGYAVVQKADGAVVRSPADVSAGEALRVRLARGEIAARVWSPGVSAPGSPPSADPPDATDAAPAHDGGVSR
jgi:exodeoxyribonuclease VII large subunit